MNLKSHYEIIISIIIVIILASSLIIYFYPHNNTYYYNNGKSINVKYFLPNCDQSFPFYNDNYTVSSYYNNGNHYYYLNTTIINPHVLYSGSGHLCLIDGITINTNVNSTYLYITVIGNDNCIVYGSYNGTLVHTSSENKYTTRINYSANTHINMNVIGINNYINNNYYNFTIKVSSGKLYNTFYINLMKESAIYGPIINYTSGQTCNVNTSIYIENMNNSKINTINIVNGYYYYFVKPYTQYKIYSLNNNTLKLIYTLNNTLISTGNSINININESDLS